MPVAPATWCLTFVCIAAQEHLATVPTEVVKPPVSPQLRRVQSGFKLKVGASFHRPSNLYKYMIQVQPQSVSVTSIDTHTHTQTSYKDNKPSFPQGIQTAMINNSPGLLSSSIATLVHVHVHVHASQHCLITILHLGGILPFAPAPGPSRWTPAGSGL